MACCNYITVLDRDTWTEAHESYVIILGERDVHDFAGDGIPHVHAYETVNVRTLLSENNRLNKENDLLIQKVNALKGATKNV